MRTSLVAVVMLALAGLRVVAADAVTPKDVVLKFYSEVFNKHDTVALDQYAAEDIVDHNPEPGQKPGREGVKAAFKAMFAAFPDLHVKPEQVLVDGNFVTVRSTLSGTQKGEFMGRPASNRAFSVMLIDIVEVVGGKCTQRWGLVDSATMMEQLAPASGKTKP